MADDVKTYDWKISALKGLKSVGVTLLGVAGSAILLYLQDEKNLQAIPQLAAYAGLITGVIRIADNALKNAGK